MSSVDDKVDKPKQECSAKHEENKETDEEGKVRDDNDDSDSGETSGNSFLFNEIENIVSAISGIKISGEIKSPKKVLEAPTVDKLVEYINSDKCKNIITMVGAGISTAAGIPDFRTPGSGLYDNLQKYNLPVPEAIFTLDYFNIDAKPFFTLAKELYADKYKPTKSHYFIKLLNEKGLLMRHYTQNIDTLERVAGIEDDKLVEAHGSFHSGHCLGCEKEYKFEWMKERIFRDEIPICEDCPGVVKPDIIFYGENLPKKFFSCIAKDFKKCDLLIVMGSSLTVYPFACLTERVKSSCPRLLINREPAGQMDFKSAKNIRDVSMLGDCDEQCQILADKLGWGDELKEMVKAEHGILTKEE